MPMSSGLILEMFSAVPKVVDRLYVRERQLSRVPNTNILYRRTEHYQSTFLCFGWGCQYPKENRYLNILVLLWITIRALHKFQDS